MSDQFEKVRARTNSLARCTDKLIDELEEALDAAALRHRSKGSYEPGSPVAVFDSYLANLDVAIEKLGVALGHVHVTFSNERMYLNDMVDESVFNEDALDFDDD